MSAAAEVVFMDLPASRAGSGTAGATAARVAPLRERPGEWARIRGGYTNPTAARAYAAIVRKGRQLGIDEGEFETATRKNDEGTWDVFARYVGGAS